MPKKGGALRPVGRRRSRRHRRQEASWRLLSEERSVGAASCVLVSQALCAACHEQVYGVSPVTEAASRVTIMGVNDIIHTAA